MKKISTWLLALATVWFTTGLEAQNVTYDVVLEPVTIPQLGGLQSFAYGEYEGRWLVLGGRLDGLHRRQPWATFDVAGHNDKIWVIDPETREAWSSAIDALPATIQEQMRSTNMEFFTEGEYMYCLGGYGYSDIAGDHTTFPYITAIDLKGVMEAVMNGQSLTPYFRQVEDAQFQVTGGHWEKIGDVYHLLGGQKFIGRYNPHGPTHGPGFVQEYTNAVRRFRINDDGTTMNIEHLSPFESEEDLHRRDYNAAPQIMPDGSEGITMFSGVFQKEVDLPFLNAVNVGAEKFEVVPDFQQLFNHYHCPVLAAYDEEENEMHTFFFGGIAQYYLENEKLIKDDNVPFVRTIARVTRNAQGEMVEVVLPTEMPDLLGASGEFLVRQDVPRYDNGVVNLSAMSGDTLDMGYIYGGIKSSAENIFFINDGTQSEAVSTLYRVKVVRSKATSTITEEAQNLPMRLFPNPGVGRIVVEVVLPRSENTRVILSDATGKVVQEYEWGKVGSGPQRYEMNVSGLRPGNYIVTVKSESGQATRKLVLAKGE
jgi:hypothetical protein